MDAVVEGLFMAVYRALAYMAPLDARRLLLRCVDGLRLGRGPVLLPFDDRALFA